jgi:hypothetical protein
VKRCSCVNTWCVVDKRLKDISPCQYIELERKCARLLNKVDGTTQTNHDKRAHIIIL